MTGWPAADDNKEVNPAGHEELSNYIAFLETQWPIALEHEHKDSNEQHPLSTARDLTGDNNDASPSQEPNAYPRSDVNLPHGRG